MFPKRFSSLYFSRRRDLKCLMSTAMGLHLWHNSLRCFGLFGLFNDLWFLGLLGALPGLFL